MNSALKFIICKHTTCESKGDIATGACDKHESFAFLILAFSPVTMHFSVVAFLFLACIVSLARFK